MVIYADIFTAGGTVKYLKYWWKTLCEVGPCLDVIQKQVKHG